MNVELFITALSVVMGVLLIGLIWVFVYAAIKDVGDVNLETFIYGDEDEDREDKHE